jgi:hypothetical protein
MFELSYSDLLDCLQSCLVLSVYVSIDNRCLIHPSSVILNTPHWKYVNQTHVMYSAS